MNFRTNRHNMISMHVITSYVLDQPVADRINLFMFVHTHAECRASIVSSYMCRSANIIILASSVTFHVSEVKHSALRS